MFSWNDDKNRLLQEQRGVGFEEVIFHMDEVLDFV
jgi:uncharacterized DUF497 family protein